MYCPRRRITNSPIVRKHAANAADTEDNPMTTIQNDTQPTLTKEELLAAPEEEYMSEAQQTYFKELLLAEREALIESARETSQNLLDNTATPDWTDRATVEEEHALELRVRDRERKL